MTVSFRVWLSGRGDFRRVFLCVFVLCPFCEGWLWHVLRVVYNVGNFICSVSLSLKDTEEYNSTVVWVKICYLFRVV